MFESPSHWTPGTETPKKLTVTNSGQVDEAVRVSYTEVWTSANSNVEGDLELTQGNNRAAIINWANTSDWTTVTENGVEYKYYNYKLAPNETTSTLLNSVTFNSAITNESNCSTEETATGKTVTCTSTGDGYDGATYKLVFTVETVQYDKYGEAWNTNVIIANTSKPAPVVAQTGAQKLLLTATNNSSITSYNDESADKGKMFVFNHEVTEQTGALTDYRYIGDVPNNFVYFNCTDDEDTDTCEKWRIIGVFSVERTDPTDSSKTITEQRIKLVRGSDFATTMKWDDRNSEDYPSNNYGKNDWNGSYMNIYINGDYFSSLSKIAQSQIEDAKYYLGAVSFDLTNYSYGATEKIYGEERGIVAYNDTRPTSWEGKVALMYPSDQYMVYINGVDNTCYSNPHSCSNGIPTSGWIYNSNILEGQSSTYYTWFLSYDPSVSYTALDSYSDGSLQYGYHIGYVYLLGVRPVVYLKSSIQIISGEGSEQKPYVLQ